MDTVEVEPVSVRVARGLAWIKENGHLVDFDLDRVNLETLDVSDGTVCVTAQASGFDSYSKAAEALEDEGIDPLEWGRDHGALPARELVLGMGMYAARQADQDALTEEWRRVIAAERA